MAVTYNIQVVVEGKDNGASNVLKGIGGGLSGIAQITGGILGADILRRIGQGLMDLGQYAFDTVGQMQQLRMSLETLAAQEILAGGGADTFTDALSKAAPMARELLDWVRELSFTSPFQYTTVAQAFQYQKSFGQTIDVAKLSTAALLDYGAAVGLTNNQLDLLGYALAQTGAAGKITAADIRQFSNSRFGVQQLAGVFEILSQKAGIAIKDHNDFNAAVSEGKITTDDFFVAFSQYVEKNFSGAAERMTTTLPGILSNLKDILFFGVADVFGESGEIVAQALLPFVNQAVSFIQSGKFKEIGTTVATTFSGMLSWFQRFTTPSAGMINILRQIGDWTRTALQIFGDFWRDNGPTIQANATLIWNALRDGVQDLWNRLGPFVTDTLAKFGDWFTENGPLIREFGTTMAERWAAIIPIILNLWTVVQPILSGIIDLVLGIIKAFMQLQTGDLKGFFTTILDTALAVFQAIWSAIVAFLETIAGAFGTSLREIGATWANIWRMALIILKFYWNQVVKSVKTYIADVSKSLSDWWKNVTIGFKSWLTGIRDNVRRGFEAVGRVLVIAMLAFLGLIITGLNLILKQFGTNVKEILQTVREGYNNIKASIQQALSAIWQQVQYWWGYMVTTISQKVTEVRLFVTTVFNSIRDTIMTIFTNIYNFLSNIWSQIRTTISTWLIDIWNTIKSYVNLWLGVFEGKLNAFLEIGRNIISSIKTGIQNAWTAFISWFTEIIAGLVQTALDTLGFQSPTSKTFIDAGYNLMNSLKIGIGRGAGVPRSALADVMRRLGFGGAGVSAGVFGAGVSAGSTTNDSSARYYAPVTYQIYTGDQSLESIIEELRVTP